MIKDPVGEKREDEFSNPSNLELPGSPLETEPFVVLNPLEARSACQQFAADVGATSPFTMRCASCGVSYAEHSHVLLDQPPENVLPARTGGYL